MQTRDLNKDELKAQRVASLATRFMESRAPISSQEIHSNFYADLSDASFGRAFDRDRDSLALCGLSVQKCGTDGTYALWKVDEDASYADGTAISAQEAYAFALACRPLLDAEGFPLSEDLGYALMKIYNSFDTAAEGAPGSHKDSPEELALCRAMASGQALQLVYERADGQRSARLVAPYGTFSFRERLYVVGPQLQKDGEVVPDSMRTYRMDRVASAKLSQTRFEVPLDFDVADYRKLPFQMGAAVCEGRFEVPASARAAVRGAGAALGENDDELVAAVSDLQDAAAWAISVGARPVAPPELVDTWKAQLEGVMLNG